MKKGIFVIFVFTCIFVFSMNTFKMNTFKMQTNVYAADDRIREGEFEYAFFEEQKVYMLTKYYGTDKQVTVPAVFRGCQVQFIGENCFKGCLVEEVTIENGVEYIGSNAFSYCSFLKKITLPNSIKNLESLTFAFCVRLEEITIPSNVTELSGSIFLGCESLKEIHFPTSVTTIVGEVFKGCKSLERINISCFVEKIVGNPFLDCPNLTSIVVDEANLNYDSRNNCNAIIETKTNKMILGCKTTIIPEDVTCIGEYAFSGAQVEEIAIPPSVVEIEKAAFFKCKSLRKITLPEAITKISDETFASCSNLVEINIPQNVTTIGNSCFYYCESLQKIILPDKLTTILNYAFRFCRKLEYISIPDSIETIESDVFRGCNSLRYNTYENGQYLGNDTNPYVVLTHLNETITQAKIAPTTKFISTGFQNLTHLTSVELPEAIKEVNDYTFYNCQKLEYVKLSNNIQSIGISAFENCSSLKTIILPATVLEIKDSAFKNCVSLEKITFSNQLSTIGISVFENCTKLVEANLSSNIKILPDNTFLNCESLSKVIIPETVEVMDARVFENCISLQEIVLPKMLRQLTANVFANCVSLQSIIFPDHIQYLGNSSFMGCTSLTQVVIPSEVTFMGYALFKGCTRLQKVTFETDKMIWISAESFMDCVALTEIRIPDSIEGIYNAAFANCTNLTSIDIEKANLYEIGEKAFFNCAKLTTIVLPSLTSVIGNNAFEGCSTLSTISIPKWVYQMGENVFFNCPKLSIYCKTDPIPNDWPSSWNGGCPVYLSSDMESPFVVDGIIYEIIDLDAHVIGFEEDITSEITIQSPIEYNGHSFAIGSIQKEAFKGCRNLQTVTIHNVAVIDEHAFYWCDNLKTVTLTGDIYVIGEEAFSGSNLTNLNIQTDTIDMIARRAFDRTPFIKNNDNYVNGLLIIDRYLLAAQEKEIKYCIIPDEVEIVANELFQWNYLLAIYIPKTCQTVQPEDFPGFATIYQEEGEEITKTRSFQYNLLYTGVQKENLKVVDDFIYLLYDGFAYITRYIGNSRYVEIPSTVTIDQTQYLVAIDDCAFRCIDNLMIYIPKEINKIGIEAFWKSNLFMESTTGKMGWHQEFQQSCLLRYNVKKENIHVYDGMVFVEENGFATLCRCNFDAEEIYIPYKIEVNGQKIIVNSIYSKAFFSCYGLKKIIIPSTISTIYKDIVGTREITVVILGDRIDLYKFIEDEDYRYPTFQIANQYFKHYTRYYGDCVIEGFDVELPSLEIPKYARQVELDIQEATFPIESITLNEEKVGTHFCIDNTYPDGLYELVITDIVGNRTNYQFILDNTAPKVEALDHQGVYNSNKKININEENLEKIILNGEEIKNGYVVDKEGNYTLTVTDLIGNKTIIHFTLDFTQPMIKAFDKEVTSSSYFNQATIAFSFEDKNIDPNRIFIDQTAINYAHLTTGITLEDGLHFIEVFDKGGNKTAHSFMVDTKAPVALNSQTNTPMADDRYYLGLTILFKDNIDEKISKVIVVNETTHKEERLENISFYTPTTIGRYHMECMDTAKNKAVFRFEIKKEGPTIIIENTTTNPYHIYQKVSFHIESKIALKQVTLDGLPYTVSFIVDKEGAHIIQAMDVNNQITSYEFIIDQTKPVILNIIDNAYYQTSLYFDFFDDFFEQATLNNQKIEKGFTIEEDGTYILEVRDKAGNTTTTHFTIDKTVPKIKYLENDTYLNLENQMIFNRQYFTFLIVDDNIEEILIDGQIKTNEEMKKEIHLTEGVHVVEVFDKAQNFRRITFMVDQTPPTVYNILDPDSVVNEVNYQEIHLACSDNSDSFDLNVSKGKNVEKVIVTNLFNQTSTIYKGTDSIDFVTRGKYQLTIIDKAGNQTIIHVEIANLSPIITIGEKVPSDAIDNIYKTISFDIMCCIEIKEITIDGAVYPINTAYTKGGKHTLKVVNVDDEISTFDFTIDNTNPQMMGIPYNKIATSEVKLIIGEENIYKTYVNGKMVPNEKTMIFTEPKDYIITIIDKAGNQTTESFSIVGETEGKGCNCNASSLSIIITSFFISIWPIIKKKKQN